MPIEPSRLAWRPYFAIGRSQIRVGVRRARPDRVCPEYRFISVGWNR